MKSINRYRITTALFLGVLGYVPLWGQNIDFTPDRPDGPAKIQSALWELAVPGAAKPTRDLQDTVVVILVPHLGQASASIDTSSLAALGGRVLAQSKSLMRVSVPASSLLAVSELPGVRFVRRPHRPHAQQETWSEGGWSIKAYDNYFEGVRGQGVKVAVIDYGFKGADELPGDMPARWWYYDYTGEGIYAGDSVHGTACAEIIHDMAQEAELYLYKVGDLVDLENVKDRSIRDGIDIINHSAGWFGTGIGDGRGEACDIVNDAADNGILWVNSAGNNAKSHYDGFWFDSDDDGWQNFSGDDEVLAFEAKEGDEISVFLTWNDWPDSRQNYDLYLSFVNSSGDIEFVDESTDLQNVSGGAPVERIEYDVEESGEYGIIVRSEDARPRRLKIWSLNHDFEEFAVAENSIGSPADARGAMSVGAVHFDYYNLGWIADYSSRGPTTDGRFKPELVAPSGVSTVSYGESEFFYGYTGTSAAAPHVAGAAALIKSANPSYSRTQLWDALVEATVDIGTRGRDNDSGHGKLVLPIMQVSASPSPQITSISPSRVQYNQVVTIHGTAFGANRGTSRVIFQGGKEPSSSQYVSWSDTQIRVRVPAGARTGNVQVITANGSDTARLTITSPWISSISPQTGRTNTVVTVSGENFGSSRGSSTVRIGSVAIPSSALASWSNSRIRFRIPINTPPGNLTVRTSEGTSNAIRLQITSPYLTSISPTRIKTGNRLTLTGGNFGTRRGSGYVLFTSNVRPSATDYVSWSNSRIVVKVPARARSGNVQVVTTNGRSGAKRLEVESASPRITSISPNRVQYNQIVTIRGTAFGASRGTSRVIFREGKVPRSSQYISWSDTQIRVRVPTGARTGDVQVVTARGRASTGLTITSPWISSISPQTGGTNTVVTVNGGNFGTSLRDISVWIGSVEVSSSSFTTWSIVRIRFRIPPNTPPGNLTVRTPEGTSNAVRLQITSPYLTSISPMQVRTGDRLTLTGGNFGTRRGSGYVLFTSNVRPSAADYVSWSNSRIVVRVPARAQSGDVQVSTSNGTSGTKRLEIGAASSPQITSVSPRQVRYNQAVTVIGSNFGSSRGSSTVRIGPVAIPSSSLASWSNTRIRFRVPTNVRSGNVTVRTSAGTSNAIRLEITSPYLASVSPSRVKPGDRLTLTGANFGSRRGDSYVLFASNVRPSSGDYVTWGDSRIVVKVPAGAQSGDVEVVVIGTGVSGAKSIIVEGDEGEVVESLPSRGLFGYSPPAVTKNPKSVKFGFGGASRDLACYFSAKEISDGEVTIFFNEWSYGSIPESEDWTHWYLVLERTDLRTGTNTIEFRNIFNQNRTSSFARWQLKDVWVGEPPSAKPVAGIQLLSKLPDGLVSGLGDPFPTPFNAEVTIPFALAETGPVRLTVYNLMGQPIRVLADGWTTAGAHSMRWDGRTDMGVEAASGVYWAVLQAGGAVQTAKLALIR